MLPCTPGLQGQGWGAMWRRGRGVPRGLSRPADRHAAPRRGNPAAEPVRYGLHGARALGPLCARGPGTPGAPPCHRLSPSLPGVTTRGSEGWLRPPTPNPPARPWGSPTRFGAQGGRCPRPEPGSLLETPLTGHQTLPRVPARPWGAAVGPGRAHSPGTVPASPGRAVRPPPPPGLGPGGTGGSGFPLCRAGAWCH